MVLAEVLNDNSISAYALTLFSIIIGGVTTAVVGIYKIRSDAKEAKNAALKAQENTTQVSNGFASGVGKKLDRIIDKQISLEDSFREHLSWHLDNQTQERN